MKNRAALFAGLALSSSCAISNVAAQSDAPAPQSPAIVIVPGGRLSKDILDSLPQGWRSDEYNYRAQSIDPCVLHPEYSWRALRDHKT